MVGGRYEVEPLSGGGMGMVWRGYDTVLDRPVAIKQILQKKEQSGAATQELLARFRREARVTAQVEHPGVPAVYDAAIDRETDDVDKLYLVMQLIEGITLSDLLAEHGRLPVAWAVAIGAQICGVLAAAHAIPVVHRDLKPSNIMIDLDGAVKVLDFGVAAVLTPDATLLTAPDAGRGPGTPDYMSPEQFRGAGASPRSDLYALGCLLHQMLAGDKVFGGVSDAALQHVNDSPTPLRMIRPEVAPALERLVLDLLAKSPDDRPADARNVFERLAPYLPTGLAAPLASGGPVGVPDPTEPYRRPLAPRRSDSSPPAAMPRASTNGQTVVLPAPVAAALTAAEERADELIADDRYSQAADLLEELLSSAPVVAAADHARVLDARAVYAGVLFFGKDYRRALSVTNDLAAAYVRVGIRDERLVNCRTQAAYCRALLGDHEAALAEFRQLLATESRTGGSQSDTALDLRRRIGELLLITNRRRECIEWLEDLVTELQAMRGPDDDSTREAESLLRRVRSSPDR